MKKNFTAHTSLSYITCPAGIPDDEVWKNISEAISESRALPEIKRRGIGFVLVFFLTLFTLIFRFLLSVRWFLYM